MEIPFFLFSWYSSASCHSRPLRLALLPLGLLGNSWAHDSDDITKQAVVDCGFLSSAHLNPRFSVGTAFRTIMAISHFLTFLSISTSLKNISTGIYSLCIIMGFTKNVSPATINWRDILNPSLSIEGWWWAQCGTSPLRVDISHEVKSVTPMPCLTDSIPHHSTLSSGSEYSLCPSSSAMLSDLWRGWYWSSLYGWTLNNHRVPAL